MSERTEEARQTISGAACAHLRVVWNPIDNQDGTNSSRWTCEMCGHKFWPEPPEPRHGHSPAPPMKNLNPNFERAAHDAELTAAAKRDLLAKLHGHGYVQSGAFTKWSEEITSELERSK
jgi:rubredoxin